MVCQKERHVSLILGRVSWGRGAGEGEELALTDSPWLRWREGRGKGITEDDKTGRSLATNV